MSRVGKKPIDIPAGVKATIENGNISVEGPKGKLEHRVPSGLKISEKDKKIVVESISPEQGALQGLTRSIVANLIKGVTEGYVKQLEIKGVGFKAQVQGAKTLEILLGFSHPVRYPIPEGITITAPKPTQIVVAGIDKVKVGEVAAEIRGYFKAEPYTGKGIRYVGEYVRHKAGKKVAK